MIESIPPIVPQSAVIVNDTSSKKRLILIVILIIGLVGFGISMMKKTSKRQTDVTVPSQTVSKSSPTTVPTLVPHPTEGVMTIKTVDGIGRIPKEQPVVLTIQASSNGKNIVGYDAILAYDNTGLTFVKAVSRLTSYKLYTFDRMTHVSFSGIKTLQDNVVGAWEKQPLIEVTFQPKKTGSFTFELAPAAKETTKLVDEKAEVVYPVTDVLEVEIY